MTNKDMKLIMTWALLWCVSVVAGDRLSEYGSYVNPHPRTYDRCPAQDLIRLSLCCNDVLCMLDDCKADDLACECCALQSMKQECYNLCPGNPSNNFLTVLYHDCEALNDINACSLPFKKDDGLPSKAKNSKEPQADSTGRISYTEDKENSVVVKSKLSSKIPSQKESIDNILTDGDENEIAENPLEVDADSPSNKKEPIQETYNITNTSGT